MMKTGKNKRLLASILAASMLLAMSPFALAEGAEDAPDTTGQGQTVEGGGAEQTYAAKIGENKYPTIADAIDAANIYDANSDVTIVMLHDVTENIEINRSLTLDLGGHTLSGQECCGSGRRHRGLYCGQRDTEPCCNHGKSGNCRRRYSYTDNPCVQY